MHGLIDARLSISALQRLLERRDVTEFTPLIFGRFGARWVFEHVVAAGGPQESLGMRWRSDERSLLFATLQ
jgi:hypothetical protein